MNKTILGVAMVVVFCITWWIVAGEAMQASQQAEQASIQADLQKQNVRQGLEEAAQASRVPTRSGKPALQELMEQLYQEARQASLQAEQASIMADAHWRTQGSWGIGAGLLADVLLLVGALAWSKLTAKA